MAIAPQRLGIGIRRHFTTEGVHPYDELAWERRDARITNFQDGSIAFEQLGVEVPSTWSVNATNILAQKYFRGTLGSAEREWSLRQVADRVVDTITQWGAKDGYFLDRTEAEAFRDELKHLVVHQKAAFNSPVWFNIGVRGVPAQASACFILAVEDRMARALRDAGFDMDLDGLDSHSLQYQNANNSVRVTDEFMQAVLDDADWELQAVTTGEPVRTVKARDLFRQIATAAWECADPGMQFDTTI